jgi:uncharacterized protein YqeY
VAGVCPPSDDIRTRLRRALGVALKAREAGTVSAVRSAMSAIGNAEAARLREGARALMAARQQGA